MLYLVIKKIIKLKENIDMKRTDNIVIENARINVRNLRRETKLIEL